MATAKAGAAFVNIDDVVEAATTPEEKLGAVIRLLERNASDQLELRRLRQRLVVELHAAPHRLLYTEIAQRAGVSAERVRQWANEELPS